MQILDKYLTGIGIDISEHHIRIAKVSIFGGVKKLEEIELPDGLIVDEKVEKLDEVKKIVSEKIKKSFSSTPVRATLLFPESRVFSSSFILPKSVKKAQVLEESKKIAQKEIPIPFLIAQVSASQGGTESGGTRTTLYAVESEHAAGFQNIVSTTPFNLIVVEANTKSILRLVSKYRDKKHLPKSSKELIIVIDVGHSWGSVAAYTLRGSSVFSRSISYKSLSKDKEGQGKLSGEVVDSIVGTIRKVMVYFNQREQKVVSIYVSGFEALDKKLNTELEKISSKETPVLLLSKVIKLANVDDNKLHKFGASIGAALRSVSPRRYAYQHNLLKNEKYEE